MNTGKAYAIFKQIESDKYTDIEKAEAIHVVLNVPTHNGITKDDMLRVLRWLLPEKTESEGKPMDINTTEHTVSITRKKKAVILNAQEVCEAVKEYIEKRGYRIDHGTAQPYLKITREGAELMGFRADLVEKTEEQE